MITIKTGALAFGAAFVFATIAFSTTHAQSVSPLIKGNVTLSITKGTIACDFVLSDLPNIENYVIRLNSGLNIHYFKDLDRPTPALYYDMDTKDSIGSDETKAYYLHENRGNPERYIPKRLEVNYLGMYPVVADSASGYMGQDWRGNIAFNGYSIRAEGLQGDWYPELYDMVKRKLYLEVRYDIHVSCPDCSVLFVNGSNVVRGTQADFKSDFPREMSLYCGKFNASENNGLWLLNMNMSKSDEQRLFLMATRDRAFYEKAFGIPFNGSLAFIQTTPTADPERWGFAFYTAPSTFNVAVGKYSMGALFEGEGSAKGRQAMAHELAHYYFGTLVRAQGDLGAVIDEGFAEYLSYELTLSLEGDSIYRKLLRDKILSLSNFRNYQPLAGVRSESDFGDREYYLYYYTPVLLIAIKKEIGEAAMWRWMKGMVNSKTERTDYQFLLSTFEKAVGDAGVAGRVVAKYFSSADALKSAVAEIGLD